MKEKAETTNMSPSGFEPQTCLSVGLNPRHFQTDVFMLPKLMSSLFENRGSYDEN